MAMPTIFFPRPLGRAVSRFNSRRRRDILERRILIMRPTRPSNALASLFCKRTNGVTPANVHIQ
ncbi:hypothetical protein NECAME_16685 [Necator americanus]|uniref:Uncharacterized protein n=1 Tax=Necator americanus TaxID=51031 RepID=W2TXE8_NECAM|nr:hypothetical protein NECAME_16685 [Necator americanus]ETN85707.1 hypothetical protein NECAME_16685 [Necator americanus]